MIGLSLDIKISTSVLFNMVVLHFCTEFCAIILIEYGDTSISRHSMFTVQ